MKKNLSVPAQRTEWLYGKTMRAGKGLGDDFSLLLSSQN
jgi:hypothetical protein